MRTRFKTLTVGLVLCTATAAGCSTSTPEPSTPAGATQDEVPKSVSSSPPPAGSYGGGIQGTGGNAGVGATDADSDPLG